MRGRRKGGRIRTVGTHTTLEIANLGEGGILPARAQQVAQRAAVHAAVAALVEELEGFAVVGRGLVVVIHCCSLHVFPCRCARASERLRKSEVRL